MSEASTGQEKTALLLLTMGPAFATAALKRMPEEEMLGILKCMGKTKVIDRSMQASVLQEFCKILEGELGNIFVDTEDITLLVEDVLGRVNGRRVMNSLVEDDGFKEIEEAPLPSLSEILTEEHPQTTALVLSRLAADKSAGVLSGLPKEIQSEACRRIAHMQSVPKEIVGAVGREISKTLKKRPEAQVGGGPVGVAFLSDLLSMAGPAVSKDVLENISLKEPEIAEKIAKGMIVFEDILRLDARSVQKLLGKIDQKNLANALKGGEQAVSEKIFENMTKEASEALIEDMESMPEVNEADAEAARQAFVIAITTFMKAGEIEFEEARAEDAKGEEAKAEDATGEAKGADDE